MEKPSFRTVALPLIADLACVLAFAFGGKSSHEGGDANWVVLEIAWPFALGAVLAHGWWLAQGRRISGGMRAGILVLVVTYVVGMALRVVTGRGIAAAFLGVALVFLAVTMLGWRAAALWIRRRT